MTAETKTVRGPCPNCGPSRWAEIVAQYSTTWSEEHTDISGSETHRLLKCCGCDTVYVEKATTFSEDVEYEIDPKTGQDFPYIPERKTYWPNISKRKQPKWLVEFIFSDQKFFDLIDELYVALDNGLLVLSAIGVRTVFDRATEILGIDTNITFAAKLRELKQNQRISDHEADILEILTDAGGAAAHRGWAPSERELATMMDILEQFLHRNLVLGEAAGSLRNAVPPRQGRRGAEPTDD